jgi:putrescine aminotransferase
MHALYVDVTKVEVADLSVAGGEIIAVEGRGHGGLVPPRCRRCNPCMARRASPWLSRAMAAFDLDLLRSLDRAHHLHPFTDHRAMHRAGTHLVRAAKGCTLVDETGKELLDGLAGLWCVNVGYGRDEIVEAVAAQMRTVAFYPSFFETTTEPSIRLAARLAQLAPAGLKRALFSNSGSEANETALKLIRAYWKLQGRREKTKILARSFAYHGVTLATTSLTGLPSCTDPFDLPLPGFVQVPGPMSYASGKSPAEYGAWCLQETERAIDREGADTIAAMFVEPVQGAGGVVVPPEGYLTGLRELCRRHEILFVADEVITGFGRLGAWFASQLWELDPDLMTMAKGITSGYVPLGATLVSDRVADVLQAGGYLAHGFTYSGHPVACAAALANLELIEREQLIERVRDDVGPLFQATLGRFASHPAVAELRGVQLIGALELRRPTSGPFAATAPNALGPAVQALAREEGVIVRGIRDLVALAPPLVVTHGELERMFAGLGRAIDRMWG